MTENRIRTVFITNEDIESVTELRMMYFDEVYSTMSEMDRKNLYNENLRILKDELNKRLYIAASFDGDKAISSAYMTVVTKAANMRFPNGRYGDIYGVFTDPKYRNMGFADREIGMILEKARELELSYVELEASGEGEHIYERNGFVDVHGTYRPMEYAFVKGIVL